MKGTKVEKCFSSKNPKTIFKELFYFEGYITCFEKEFKIKWMRKSELFDKNFFWKTLTVTFLKILRETFSPVVPVKRTSQPRKLSADKIL